MTEPCKKICKNCADWEAISGVSFGFGECINDNVIMPSTETCDEFNADQFKFCGVCNHIAKEGEHSSMECTNNDDHGATQWDYQWHDFSAT